MFTEGRIPDLSYFYVGCLFSMGFSGHHSSLGPTQDPCKNFDLKKRKKLDQNKGKLFAVFFTAAAAQCFPTALTGLDNEMKICGNLSKFQLKDVPFSEFMMLHLLAWGI